MIPLSKIFDGEVLLTSIIGIIGLCLSFKRNKQLSIFLLLLLFLAFIWRYVFSFRIDFSSRYLLAIHLFLIYFSVYCLLFFRKHPSSKYLLFLVVFALLIYQSFKTFSTFNNIYILDLRGTVDRIVQADSNASFAIDEKEFNRLAPAKQHSELFNSSKGASYLSLFLNSYITWGHDLFIISKDINNELIDVQSSDNRKFEIKHLSCFKTGKGSKTISLFLYSSLNDIAQDIPAENNSKNKISNGSFEIPATPESTKKQFNKWITNGAYFYGLNNILLPRSNNPILPTNWDISTRKNYPVVFLDNSDPIEGQFSLHVIFYKFDSYFPLWLLNRFEAESGDLSFKIKSLDGNTTLKLTRVDFQKDGKWFNAPQEYNIYLSDADVHTVLIHVDQDDFIAPLTFFRLLIKDANILLDSVQFIPNDQKTL